MPTQAVRAKWRRLALLLIYGDNGRPVSNSEAYRMVYPKASIRGSKVNACKLLKLPEFREIFSEEFEIYRTTAVEHPLATRRGQIEAKLSRLADLYRIVEERARAHGGFEELPDWRELYLRLTRAADRRFGDTEAEELAESLRRFTEAAPGGGTGWIVRQESERAVNFKLDAGLLAEIRALEAEILELSPEAVAKRVDLTSGGKAIGSDIDLSKLSVQQLAQLHEILKCAEAAPTS